MNEQALEDFISQIKEEVQDEIPTVLECTCSLDPLIRAVVIAVLQAFDIE